MKAFYLMWVIILSMKKIYIYPIRSMMSHGDMISSDSEKLLSSLSSLLDDYDFEFIDNFKKANEDGIVLILVQSGGSEGIFKNEVYPKFKGPYYLLTYGSSNSLAASLEILTFLKQNNKKAEVLHGNDEYIAKRIKTIAESENVYSVSRLGIIGEPSDWLISSYVDKKQCLETFGIELVDIPQEEVIEEIKAAKEEKDTAYNFEYDKKELSKALKIYAALKKIVEKYSLSGFTIRCFDIIKEIKSSACLALSLFNKDDVIASCEGDVPAMITAYLALKKLKVHSFQCNPQWIDPSKDEIYFAHCTLPLDMAKSITLSTHFESGIGIGIHGEMEEGDVTILKIGAKLDEFYCEEGVIEKNEYRKDRCRTQIKIKMNSSVRYFLSASLGNHHQVIYGHHRKEISEYLSSFGLRQVI